MKILCVTINAKNIHKAIAPWCLKAYADSMSAKPGSSAPTPDSVSAKPDAKLPAYADAQSPTPQLDILILETSVNDVIMDTIAKIHEVRADVIAFSCYIWNAELIKKIGNEIRKIDKNVKIVIGGPEVSFEENLNSFPFCDAILCGEGEQIFYELMMKIKNGESFPQIIKCNKSLDLNEIPSPYTDEYFASFTPEGIPIDKQLIYFESSRGCPFSCAYCLSSVHDGVKFLSIEKVKERLDKLVKHGAKIIKFVDRTFNANQKHALAILELVKEYEEECTFHFEISADLVTERFMEIVANMPDRRVQFEIGIQSTNDQTLEALNRKTNTKKVLEIVEKLSELRNCHIHVDLIAGLPHETYQIFKDSFNETLSAKPHVLQLGFLKMLRGSAMRDRAEEFNYQYLDFAPYEVMENEFISFTELTILKGIEKALDKFYNTGKFSESIMYTINNAFSGDYFAFFEEFAKYCKMINRDPKYSLKNSYTILYKFMKNYFKEDVAGHYIKLDCLTNDPKGMLPDDIEENRDRDAEYAYKKQNGKCKMRIEYFPYDGQTRTFIYGV